ncbi:MAG: diacylglycerol/lipid kinase family protein [Chloroflexota bacterium]
MAKVTMVVNPAAGGGQSARRWERLEPSLRAAGLDFESVFTTSQGDGIRLARTAVDAGVEMLVAVGGDGTINEVANGILLATAGEAAQVRLAVLPTGRGVDLCRTVGIPLDGVEATQRLFGGRTIGLDVGEMEYTVEGHAARRFFLNFAGMGWDVEVTRRASRSGPQKSGTIPYLSAVLASLLSFKSKRVEIVLDGEVLRRKVATVVVANGQYFGGGMRVAPSASPVDGLFDVVVLGDMSKWELLTNLPKVYEGTHITHPKVQVWRAREVEVHSVDPVYVQVDGDPLGETPARVRMLPAALQLVV